jgi:hypothetical protein
MAFTREAQVADRRSGPRIRITLVTVFAVILWSIFLVLCTATGMRYKSRLLTRPGQAINFVEGPAFGKAEGRIDVAAWGEPLEVTAAQRSEQVATAQRIFPNAVVRRLDAEEFLIGKPLLSLRRQDDELAGERRPALGTEAYQSAVAFFVLDTKALSNFSEDAHALDPFDEKAFIPPLKPPVLVFSGLAPAEQGFADFVVASKSRVHVILADEGVRPRVLYMVGSLAERKWISDAYVLDHFHGGPLPRGSVVAAANGQIHLFWVRVRASGESLMHAQVGDLPASIKCEEMARAESVSYVAAALSNGDLAVYLVATNFEQTFDFLGLRIGSDISERLRVLHDGNWSRWTRVVRHSKRSGQGQEFYFRQGTCTMQEIGNSLLGLFPRDGPNGLILGYKLLP